MKAKPEADGIPPLSPKRHSFEVVLCGWILLAGLPSAILALWALQRLGLSGAALGLIGMVLFGSIGYLTYFAHFRFTYHLRTIANLMEALEHGDYSLRGRTTQVVDPRQRGAYDEVVRQINRLAETLKSRRLEAKESQLLLAKVVNNIAIALVAVSDEGRIVHVNKAFCELYGRPEESLLRNSAFALNLMPLLTCNTDTSLSHGFPKKTGRFSIYRDRFIEEGEPHTLILITDVKSLLRSEEQQAWQKLFRVLGHEINNSLTPISSLSASLQNMIGDPRKETMLRDSLQVIHERSLSLVKLVSGYKELARMPAPKRGPVDLLALCQKIQTLYAGTAIEIRHDLDAYPLDADAVLLEQVLINLVKNALESQAIQFPLIPLSERPAIELSLYKVGNKTFIEVLDQGTGIQNPSNLFVPLYSTKPNGSGIGLVLSRQIVEAHGGELSLQNRDSCRGVCARLELGV